MLAIGTKFSLEMAKVIVAAIRNWKVIIASDPKELHELDLGEYVEARKFRIDPTLGLRFLSKTDARTGLGDPWKFCSVTQVEKTKQMLRMIPILVCSKHNGDQINTLLVK